MPEFTKRNFTAGEISPTLHARADLKKYTAALATLKNFFIHPEGGVSTRPGFQYIGPVRDNRPTCRLIPFQFNTEQTYVLEFTNNTMRVIKDGGYVLTNSNSITGISQANPAVVTANGHGYGNGDEVFISGVSGMNEINSGFYDVVNATANTFELSGVDSSAYGAYASGGTVSKIYKISAPYPDADIPDLKYTQSADVMTFVHPNYNVRELSRTDHDAWTFTTVSYAPTLSAPTGINAVAGGTGAGSYDRQYEYVVTAVDDTGVESVQSSPATITTASLSQTAYVQVTWNSVGGADYYNIYKAESADADVYGFVGKSNTLAFRDYNLAPTVDDTPPVDRQPFSGSGNRPSTVNYYQQRLMFGASNNNPQTVWASQSGNYSSMRVSQPTRDDDAITFTIASQKVNEIRHIVALDSLIILTSGGEWQVTEGQDDVLTPSTVGVKPQSFFGASDVMPVYVGNDALYIQERGSRLRSIGYKFETDNYTGTDLSILAQHLFEEFEILDMQYAQEPRSTIYALRDDGVLLGCTYHKDHDVLGWYRYEVGGSIKSMAVIAEGFEDVLYVVVERLINGVSKRYVERLKERTWHVAEDAFCVDCSATYSGSPVTKIYGLHHLAGETVVALADGNVEKGLVVASDGTATLAVPSSKVHIGFAYDCDLETLDIDAGEMDVVVRGKRKTVNSVVLSFLESRGGFLGQSSDQLFEMKPRLDGDGYSAIDLRTYEFEQQMGAGWTSGGRVFFRQSDPVPATILLIAPEVSIG